MAEVSNKVRREAAAMVIDECKQWLNQVIEAEVEKIREEARQIADSRQKIEQIAADFEEETKDKTSKHQSPSFTESDGDLSEGETHNQGGEEVS